MKFRDWYEEADMPEKIDGVWIDLEKRRQSGWQLQRNIRDSRRSPPRWLRSHRRERHILLNLLNLKADRLA